MLCVAWLQILFDRFFPSSFSSLPLPLRVRSSITLEWEAAGAVIPGVGCGIPRAGIKYILELLQVI